MHSSSHTLQSQMPLLKLADLDGRAMLATHTDLADKIEPQKGLAKAE